MGGWFVDIYVEYLFRIMVRLFKTCGKGTWPVVEGTVTDSDCPASALGCPVAEIYYKYVVAGELYTGIHEKAFILLSSAEHYAHQLAAGAHLKVRLDPTSAAISVVLDRDQTLRYTVDSRAL